MRIVSWNCHYGFCEDKPRIIGGYNADILVVPECREMDMEASGYAKDRRDWYGDHKEASDTSSKINAEKDLGIGIFWKDGLTLTRLPEWDSSFKNNSDFRYLVPYTVKGKFETFTLIAVWTKGSTGKGDSLEYVEKAHAAVDHYKKQGLLDDRVILVGDFNSNTIWNTDYRKDRNHSTLVEKMESWGIKNCSEHDEKEYFTYCYFHGKEKTVVDDYCFASTELADKAKFSVPDTGKWQPDGAGLIRWSGLSDHCPIIVDFDL